MRRGRWLAAGTVVILAITGCSNSSGTDAKKGGQVESASPTEIVVYYPFANDWSPQKFDQTFTQPLTKKYPNFTIKYIVGGTTGNSISELVAAGTKIDIVASSIGVTPAQLLDVGLQYDITPLIQKNKYDLTKIDPALIDLAKQMADGGIYGLPVLLPPSTIYYNKDIFDHFGLPYPKDGMTWDDMLSLSNNLTRQDNGTQYYGFAMANSFYMLLNPFSIPLVDKKSLTSTFGTDERWASYADYYARIYKPDAYATLGDEKKAFFKDKRLAMLAALSSLEAAENLTGLNFDLAPYPVYKEHPDLGPQAYPTYFYITKNSAVKDQAFQAISYWTSDEFQTESAKKGYFIPISSNSDVMKTFGQDNPAYKGKNVQALRPKKYAPAGAITKYDNKASQMIDLKKVSRGTEDMNTLLRESGDAVNKLIQQQEAAKN